MTVMRSLVPAEAGTCVTAAANTNPHLEEARTEIKIGSLVFRSQRPKIEEYYIQLSVRAYLSSRLLRKSITNGKGIIKNGNRDSAGEMPPPSGNVRITLTLQDLHFLVL